MQLEEFEQFLSDHPAVEWKPVVFTSDGDMQEVEELHLSTGVCFRIPGLPYYDNGGVSYCPRARLQSGTPEMLWRELNQGLQIEQITRITGYFTKVSGWNRGKLKELYDRHRNPGFSTPPAAGPTSPCMPGVPASYRNAQSA